ncbi:acetyl-CoA acetyltransferase [Actinocorallia herbida]|uniref:Acetyl-CoA acetyltransferase n=1 Tax=Actinocorallia herbida TaxID=58109 RepID=A0A3N1D378_9ACTN|nr:thiolase family protein [Actinocorallia herbida]ROO87984.1 acetyl-CoA acetyltransferase [Actinocorallia herbida]
MTKFEYDTAITGIGRSDIGRRLGRSGLDLTVQAARAAVSDAGLTMADIDGLVAWPGEYPAAPGFNGPSPWRVKSALDLELSWHLACQEGPSQFTPVMAAAMAVSTGMARHVLVYRTTEEATAQGTGKRVLTNGADQGGVTGFLQWHRPFGAVSAANWLALNYQRYLHETGSRREQVGWLAVNARRFAAGNPAAIYTAPLTIDDYLGARMITDPFCLYDCDVPADGSVALVVSAAETAGDAPQAVAIEAVGSAVSARTEWDQWRRPTQMAAQDAARHLWSRTDLKPSDVDTAQLYDGFTFLTLVWLEALGFCAEGEAPAFVEGGRNITLGGALPLNTSGGQLSAGRLHGWGHLYEACLQIRGEAGARQVDGAEVALAAAGGGPHGGCLLLTKPR